MNQDTRKIQITIPVLNPQSSFYTYSIPLLYQQTFVSSLLLINSGENNITVEKSKVLNIPLHEFGHANTRNLVLNYEADFYLFMTQDAIPYDEFLIENLLKAFEDPNVVVSYARQIPYKDADSIEVFARTSNYPEVSKIKTKADLPILGIKTFFCSNSCSMYRVSYFKEVGGFKKDLNTNEDMEFAAHAILDGKKVAYMAEAKVYHSHAFTCKDIWKRYQAIGRFFLENRWILYEVDKYNKAESTGIKQAINELKYLLKKSPWSIPRSCLCSLLKFIAFKSVY
jgi:rhamnosyltransferase